MSQFTSRSEFDLEKRVRFTNEIPPYDMFDGLNSVLQTDLWKWVLGYTKVEFGLPYDIDVQYFNGVYNDDGTPKYDVVRERESGIENGEVYYKMVNGKVVEDVQYGPAPNSKSTYHKLEEYGVVLPEFDYLLHEVYRYLGSMYPDHPDMIELLTPNEFDDMITNAGSVIDYEPDNKFFDKVANSFNNGNKSEVELEAAMLKIRNLKNEGFRKRLYGSKMGYRMLANDIFQTATVFPVATYLPIKPIDKKTYRDGVGTYDYVLKSESGEELGRLPQRVINEGSNFDIKDGEKVVVEPISPITDADALKKWNEETGHSFTTEQYRDYIRQHNRVIDTYSKYYYKKFRLVDYDGSKSSYPAPEDKNLYTYGYTVPFHEYNIFEYPACSDSYSTISGATYSSTLKSKDFDSPTSYVMGIEPDVPLKEIKYNYTNSYYNNVMVEEMVALEVHNIKTSIRNFTPFKTLYLYPEFASKTLSQEEFDAIEAKNKDALSVKKAREYPTANMLTFYYTIKSGEGFTKERLKDIIKPLDAIYNPFVKDTLFLKPSDTLSFYPYSVTAKGNENSQYYIIETPLEWNAIDRYSYISSDNLSDDNTNSITSVAQVTNFTKGYIDINIDPELATKYAQIFDIAENQPIDDRYALVIENEDKNLVVVEGKLHVETTLSGGRYETTREHFDIAAVPEFKTDYMLGLLYEDYSSVVAQTKATGYEKGVEAPVTHRDYVDAAVENGYNEQWARDYYSDDDNVYAKAKENIMASELEYTDFLKRVKELIACEEQIAAWRENRSYIYKETTYELDYEEVPYENTLIFPGCKVVGLMKAALPLLLSNESEYNVVLVQDENGNLIEQKELNHNYYQDKVTYSVLEPITTGYVPGEITDISFGNLNVVSIYGYNESNGVYISSTKEVEDLSITLSSPEGKSCVFNCLTVNKQIVEHDNTSVFDYNNTELIVRDYYEQSISSLDENLVNYTSGKISSDFTNITITPIERETIQIESVINTKIEGMERIISFESDVAKEMFKSISVGDVITGPSIDSDDGNVFVVDVGDNEVTVNVDLQQSGTFVLNYDVKTNVAPTDIENNLVQYKEDLYNNGLYSVTNPFEHGLWPSADFPNVSTAILDSLPDVSFYNIHNYRNGSHNSFTTILEDTHWDEYIELLKEDNTTDKYVMPSDIKFNNELFLELNLNKLIYYPTHKTETSPVLMSVEWLDYIENSLMYSSRATDNVNVGVNLMMETDTSGYYTMYSQQQYTDPQIRLKFITLNLDGQNMWPEKTVSDNDWVTPCYAQVGTGGSGRKRWFKSPEDVTYPSIWGSTVFDNVKDARTYNENSELYRNNGELRNVGVWGQNLSEFGVRKNTTKYNSVENPLFEIPLGEYDTITKYISESNARNLLSITQASFYSQTFTNLLKHFDSKEGKVKIVGTDISNDNILTSYGETNNRVFTYSGIWTPTKTECYDENGVITDYFSIVYPPDPTDLTYYVVDADVNLSNIGTSAENKTSRLFNRSDVLFRYNGKWYLKRFQYMGVLGDGLDTYEPVYNLGGTLVNYNRIRVASENNKALSEPCTTGKLVPTYDEYGNVIISEETNRPVYEDNTYYPTLVERLIQYYLNASKTQTTSYYSDTVPNIGFKEYGHYYYIDGYEHTHAERYRKYTFEDAFKDLNTITPIHNDHILYYIYAGSFHVDESNDILDTLWRTQRDRKWLVEDQSIASYVENYRNEADTPQEIKDKVYSIPSAQDYSPTFKYGDRLALLNFCPAYAEDSLTNKNEDGTYIECESPDDWFLFKVNTDSLLGATLPISKWRHVQDEELKVIADSNEYVPDEKKCGITTLLDETCSVIDLPRSYITEGSYNFNITVDPHFISDGYLYDDDLTTLHKDDAHLVRFCTTKGAIYRDDLNDSFYTFSNLEENGKLSEESYKVALKFNEQRFFKNTLKVPGIYQVRNSILTGEKEPTQTPTFKSITGVEFPLDKLATGDRLLEVKKLDLRSIYSTTLEPVFFSNYYNVNYPIKGVTKENELYLSYISNSPDSPVEKMNFTTNVMNLLPVNNIFDKDTNSYTTELATTETTIDYGKEFPNPQLSNINITKSLNDDKMFVKPDGFINREFAYFKNNLVVRGKVDATSPKVILTPGLDSSLFKDAVQKISMGDSLIGAYALGPTGNESKFQIRIIVDGNVIDNAEIQYAYFANNQFRAVEKSGIVYYNDDIDVPSVTTDISCKRAVMFDNPSNNGYRGDVRMVGYTPDLKWYVEITLKNTTSIICTMDIDVNGTVNLSQAYMGNGKHVYVDYTNNNVEDHTLVGHTLGEYNTDFIKPTTLTIKYSEGSKKGQTEGLQLLSEDTNVSVDGLGHKVWETTIKDNNTGNVKYTLKTTIEKTEEFFKAIITDTATLEPLLKTFDGSIGNSINYNVEKIDTDGKVVMYLVYDGSSSEKTVANVVDVTYNNGVASKYTNNKAELYISESAGIWKEYTYGNVGGTSPNVTIDDSVKYTYEKSDDLLLKLDEDGVVTGIGKTYTSDFYGTREEDVQVFYRDIALTDAKLTQDKDDPNLYKVDTNYKSEPYFTDTVMTVNPNGTKNLVAKTLNSRAILKKDNSGKYTVYAKGRSLFVKSPTSLLEKDESSGKYKYNGLLTAESFWKHANAPIFNEKMFLSIRSTLVTDKSTVDGLVDASISRWVSVLFNRVNLEQASNAGITVDGRPMNIDRDNTLLDNLKEIFRKISGFENYDVANSSLVYRNHVTYDTTVAAMDKAKKNPGEWFCADTNTSTFAISGSEVYPLVVSYSGYKWTFRCYGFKIIEETVTDGYDVIGASKQKFAQLPPTASQLSSFYEVFTLDDDAPDANYEHAYAMFAYYFSYYLCGNAQNTEVVSSSNVSDIQFTDNSMLVTDAKGNINSIGLCYLHNRDDIENPEHWSHSAVPMELSCYTIENNVAGYANYKIGNQNLSVPKPEVLTKQNTFSVECSYANDEIILLGGYILAKDSISAMYDNFMRADRTENEYQAWKAARTKEEIEIEDTLLEPSAFKSSGTPMVLYSVDKGATFEMMELKSTTGKVFNWELSKQNQQDPLVDYYVSGIVYAEKEYKIFVSKTDSDDKLEFYYYLKADEDDGAFDFSKTSGTKDMDEYGDIAKAHEFDIDAVTGTNDFSPAAFASTSSVNTIPSGHYRMMFTEGENCFYILSTMAVRFGEDVTVASKTTGSITLSSPLVAEGNAEFDILLAFNTRENISNSIAYLNMERADKYVNEIGELRVPESTLTEDTNLANRFYSYREILQPEARVPGNDSYDPYGYPSVIEDQNYDLYEYDTVYDADSGQSFYTHKIMQNKNAEDVYLCDSTGKHLIYTDDTGRNMLGTLAMRGQYPIEMFKKAPIPIYATLEAAENNPSIRASDDDFRGLLDLEGSNIVSICYDNDTPYVKVSTNNVVLAKDVKDYLFMEEDSEDFVNYLSSTTPYLNSNTTYGSNINFTDASGNVSITKIKEALSKITYNAGTINNPDPMTLFSLEEVYTSLEDVTTVDADGVETTKKQNVVHFAWYDNQAKEFLLKKKRYFSALAYVPYCFKAGLTAYKNVGFPTVNGSGGIDVPNPITGVYLSNYGYGGSRSNKDLWENTLPWLVDPEAFSETEYLKNTKGENVYLVDASGAEIKSYNAETERTVGSSFKVDLDNLNGQSSKDIYVYSNKNNIVSQKIYNPVRGDTKIFTPVDTLTIGENPFEIDLWAYNSYKLIDLDTKVDNNGKVVPNISIRYYGLLRKNVYNELACDKTDEVKGITPDFIYDPKAKVIRYLGSSTLENNFWVSPDNKVDVSKLNVTFYVKGEKFTVSYKLNFAQNPEVTTVMTDKGVFERSFKVVGSSSYSIHFNAFTLYQQKGTIYTTVNYKFNENVANIINESTLKLSVGTLSTYDDGSSYIDPIQFDLTTVTQNCLLNSQYENKVVDSSTGKIDKGWLVINNRPIVETPKDTIKTLINGKQYSINVPIVVLGNVTTYEDYVIENIENNTTTGTIDITGHWIRQTYIDDTHIDTLFPVHYNNDLTVTIGDSEIISTMSVTDALEETKVGYELNTFKNVLPKLVSNKTPGYYLNMYNGSVFNESEGVNNLTVQILKLDPEGELIDNVYTNGIYDKIPCRMPLYDSFRELINAKSFVINKGVDSMLYERKESDNITVAATNADDVMFSLTEPLDVDGLNDGEEHYIVMKWLTQSTVRTDLSICADKDAFVEINLTDKKLFTPDRVWFNPNGYPTPTVSIGNNVFNAKNNGVYESSSYKNNNGYTIYRCNEDGFLVGYSCSFDKETINSYDIDNDGLPENVEGYILNDDGSVKAIAREYVLDPTSNVLADAMVPKKPTFDSCQEWFQNEFYIKGHESNPYWQVLKISSKFNNAKKIWEQFMSVNEYVRSTQEMVLQEIEESDRYVKPVRAIKFEQKDSSYLVSPDADIVDLKTGALRFVLDRPAEKYQTESQFIKYGITAENPFYGDPLWTGSNLSLASYLDSTYTVCSTENLADPRDTESEIQEVTEFGLFNKYHQLIAYAVFPPIEYRTNSQHISFTCYVKQGSCVDPATLDN